MSCDDEDLYIDFNEDYSCYEDAFCGWDNKQVPVPKPKPKSTGCKIHKKQYNKANKQTHTRNQQRMKKYAGFGSMG